MRDDNKSFVGRRSLRLHKVSLEFNDSLRKDVIEQLTTILNDENGKSHQGYYGPVGFAGQVLKEILADLTQEKSK